MTEQAFDDRVRGMCVDLDRRIFEGDSLEDLLTFAAEQLVHLLDLPLVWIGLKENGGLRHPTAAGPERDYLEHVRIRWDETPEGRGPTGRAVRTGESVAADVAEDPSFEPWREAALRHGLASALAVPLHGEEEVLGVLGAYGREPGSFDREQVARLEHLGAHLSLALRRHRSLQALEESERRLRQMAENIEEVFYLHDPELEEIFYLNPAYEEIWGRPVEEVLEAPRTWLEAVHPDDRELATVAAEEAAETGFEIEYRVVRPDGEVRWVRDRGFPVFDQEEELARVAGVVSDITERKEAEERLRRQEKRYRALFEDAGDAVVVTDLEGRIREANDAFLALSGYRRDELLGAPSEHFYLDPDRRDELVAALREEGRVRNFEARFLRGDGQPRDCVVAASLIETGAGEFRIQATIRDVTERVRHEEELRYEALHDWLTDLPNRALFRDRLDQVLTRADRSGRPAGLLYVDLNGFKAINDTHGHEAGDRVLVETARRLAGAVRASDTVARIGGDEFVVILPEIGGPAEAEQLADRIRDQFATEMEVVGDAVAVTAAIGAALTTRDDVPGALSPDEARADPERLLRRADRAMYRAKEEPGSAVRMYRPGEATEA